MTIMRNSNLYDMVQDRAVTQEEIFALQGFAHPGLWPSSIFAADFPVSDRLKKHQVLNLIGNGMHLASVGSTWLMALACTELELTS